MCHTLVGSISPAKGKEDRQASPGRVTTVTVTCHHGSEGANAAASACVGPMDQKKEVPMRVQSILAQKGNHVASIRPDATVFDASRELSGHGVGALLVSSDGTTIDGILSERDVARSLALHGERAVTMTVSELMTVEVRTCSPTDTVDDLMVVMTTHRIRHVPVVDGNGTLAGLISIGDVVKHRVGELEQEAQTLHDYIELGR